MATHIFVCDECDYEKSYTVTDGYRDISDHICVKKEKEPEESNEVDADLLSSKLYSIKGKWSLTEDAE